MIRRLFAPRTRRAPIRRPNARLHLEQLEKREVLDAALIQGLNYLTLNAYQSAQQCVQLQATAQADLAHFQQDGAAYTAGKGVSLAQINQDIAALKQDANSAPRGGTFSSWMARQNRGTKARMLFWPSMSNNE
jgi:hypothetical protein